MHPVAQPIPQPDTFGHQQVQFLRDLDAKRHRIAKRQRKGFGLAHTGAEPKRQSQCDGQCLRKPDSERHTRRFPECDHHKHAHGQTQPKRHAQRHGPIQSLPEALRDPIRDGLSPGAHAASKRRTQ